VKIWGFFVILSNYNDKKNKRKFLNIFVKSKISNMSMGIKIEKI